MRRLLRSEGRPHLRRIRWTDLHPILPTTDTDVKLRYRILSGAAGVLVLASAAAALLLSRTAPCPEPAADTASAETDRLSVEMMRAWVHRCYGETDVLRLERRPRPSPAGNEVLVEVAAAAVNPYDWAIMTGSPYFLRLGTGLGHPREPRFGADFAGKVVAVGEEVTRFAPGDEVFGRADGTFAEYLTVAEDAAVAAKPPNVSFEQAATAGIAALTAIQGLRDHGRLQPGEAVLINGASGGVGTFAVQIARSMGAEVTGVCSGPKMARVRAIGAHHVMDYRQVDYTAGEGRYDLILDLVGNHSVRANSRVLEPDGRLVIAGGPKGDWFAPLKPVIEPVLMSPFVEQEAGAMLATLNRDDAMHLAALMREGAVVPVVDRAFPLEEVPAAMEYWRSGQATGKVVVTVR